MKRLGIAILVALLSVGCAARQPALPPVDGPAAFERLKTLEGRWETTSDKDNSPQTVVYRVTSGGNAIEETLFPGSPEEMISVFYKEGNSVGMTHYCMLDNRPTLKLVRSTDDTLEFALDPKASGDLENQSHMHALTLTFDSPKQVTAHWVGYKDGKPAHNSDFVLTRACDCSECDYKKHHHHEKKVITKTVAKTKKSAPLKKK